MKDDHTSLKFLEHKLDQLLTLQQQTLEVTKARFLTAKEFAQRTGLKEKVILDKCERLQLAHKKEGRSIIIPYYELERWLQEAEEQRLVDEKCKTRRNRLMAKASTGKQ
jgi:predicted DNA-binding transcriptional regulator AlpA